MEGERVGRVESLTARSLRHVKAALFEEPGIYGKDVDHYQHAPLVGPFCWQERLTDFA